MFVSFILVIKGMDTSGYGKIHIPYMYPPSVVIKALLALVLVLESSMIVMVT